MNSEAEITAMKETTNSDYPQKTKLGNILKNTRETLHLSQKEVALRLHLNPAIISIMETEEFQKGPPAIFMKGYLRSYARILNIPVDFVESAIKQLETSIPQTPNPCAPPILTAQPTISRHHHYFRLMTYIIPLILIGLMAMWWFNSPSKDIAQPVQPKPTQLNSVKQPAPPQPAELIKQEKPLDEMQMALPEPGLE